MVHIKKKKKTLKKIKRLNQLVKKKKKMEPGYRHCPPHKRSGDHK